MSATKNTTEPTVTTEAYYRARYCKLITEAAGLGWTSTYLQAEAASLAAYYQGRGESIPKSWCSAAQEVIDVEQESRAS